MTGAGIDARVIGGCCLRNGAIVAADTDDPSYPADAKAYRYVWPRDAAYSCRALDVMGLSRLSKRFYGWCLDRAFGMEDGLFWENYHTNGSPNDQSGFRQLDQTGQVLWAIHGTYGGKMPGGKAGKLVSLLADGLATVWDGGGFSVECTDLWEERTAYPELGQAFSYTLAAASKGMACAHSMSDRQEYGIVADEMAQVLGEWSGKVFPRMTGKLCDVRVDASLLGLAWPHDVLGHDRRVKATVDLIEKRLRRDGGLLRYEGDEYDGWQRGTRTYKMGAGTWPLLSLWMALTQWSLGRKAKARKYYESVGGGLFPEQALGSGERSSVTPLCWAHSLHAIAADMLGP